MLCALLRFLLDLHLSPTEIASAADIERNFSRQICVVNDICSWEKEVKAATTTPANGGGEHVFCSAVKVLADETRLTPAATKGILWTMVRAWDQRHAELALEREGSSSAAEGCSEALKGYMKGFEAIFVGHEEWCLTTRRYRPAVLASG